MNPSIVGLSSSGRYLVTNTTKRGLMLHELEPEVHPLHAFGNVSTYSDIQLSDTPTGVTILVVEATSGEASAPGMETEADSVIAAFNFAQDTGEITPTLLTKSTGRITTFDRHLTEPLIAVGASNGNVRIWQTVFDVPRTPILQVPDQCRLVKFVNKQQFRTVAGDGQIRLWDTAQNSLGEEVLPNEICSLSPHRINRVERKQLQYFTAPDGESTIVSAKLSDGRYVTAVGDYAGITFKASQELQIERRCDAVLFTPDSRYALILSRMVRDLTGGLSPLLNQSQASGLAQAPIPATSKLWVYDFQSAALVGDGVALDGPMIGASIDQKNARVMVGTLSRRRNRGTFTTFDLKTLEEMHDFGDDIVPFVKMSRSANHDAVAVVSQNAVPYLYRRGQMRPISLLSYMDADVILGERFSKALISESGRHVLLVQAANQSNLTLIDLDREVATRFRVEQTNLAALIERIPGKDQFVVCTATGELFVVDGPTAKVLYKEELGCRCVSMAIDSTGSRTAVISVSGVLHIRNLPGGNLVIPDMPIPFVDAGRVIDTDYGYWKLTFLDSGDILVGDAPIQRLRLSSADDDEGRLDLAASALLNESPFRRLRDDGNNTADFAELDWYDKYALSREVDPRHRVATLEELEKIDFSQLPSSTYATELAFRRISLGVMENRTTPCRKALEFILETETPENLSTDKARAVIANLQKCDIKRSLKFLDEFEAANHDASFNISGLVLPLLRGHSVAALGRYGEAIDHYSTALSSPAVVMTEGYNQQAIAPIRVEQALVLLKLTQRQESIASLFERLTSRDPRIVVGRAWINYLLGVDQAPEFDSKRSPMSKDATIDPFLFFYTAMTAKDVDEAIRFADLLIEKASDAYRFESNRPAFPVTRAHALLLKADALKLAGESQAASELLPEAELHWQTFVKSAVDQGIDSRVLWPWRVSYEHLLQRHQDDASGTNK